MTKLLLTKAGSLLIACVFALCIGCKNEESVPVYDAKHNFDALWTILNEKYCFFEYKEIDWQEVYDRYSEQVTDDISEKELFYLMGDMLAELEDGHVNLTSPFDITRYWDWYEDYPSNFSSSVQEHYLGEDYKIAGGFRYNRIKNDEIGYIYYGSFSSGISLTSIAYVFDHFKDCRGLIIDVRNNGGGILTNADKIASCFTAEKTLTGYIQHKLSPAHGDFSEPYPIYVEPAAGLLWERTVVVLTNRYCYSAANDFVCKMGTLPQVTVIGDKTGGGSGLPFSAEIPNGWGIRFSASPILNANKEHTEFGIEPDVKVHMSYEDMLRGEDTIIEEAVSFINGN